MGTFQPVPTPPTVSFGAHFDVPFDPVALDSQRRTIRKLLTLNTVLWAVVAVILVIAIVYTLSTAGEFFMLALGLMLVGVCPILALTLIRLAMSIVNRGRTTLWLLTPPAPGIVALRFSATGVWVGTTAVPGGASYAWNDLQRVRLRIYMREKVITVSPAKGVQPDRSVLVGFEGLLDPLQGLRKAFGMRGPRVPARSLAVPLDVISAALQHYSAGRFKL